MMMVQALSSPISFFRVTLSGIFSFFPLRAAQLRVRAQMLLFCPSMSISSAGPVRSVQSPGLPSSLSRGVKGLRLRNRLSLFGLEC